ncbi:hypothetical protein [Acidithiobacillus sulfurivorans]|uniref:Uncharacterized protein n=1 Tax=Acidithiobacillus sulfurivorans TaxID=1958756 RepID=A0ABS5ZU04_9PROT|nr:hypothetical protein [Acidithiobacillus sulfurivorans]MBU2758654.1 hypothetical protein [Acidithiobacillus sulfurivorans]
MQVRSRPLAGLTGVVEGIPAKRMFGATLEILFLGIDAMTDSTNESREHFLARMARYTQSMNGVPVDRVSIPTADLLRLINMTTSQQALFKVRTDWIPPFSRERM